MNRIISLLCPTRGRPDRVCVMIESVIKTTEKLENVEILFYIDSDDDKKDDYIVSINNLLNKYNNPFKRVLPHIGEPMSVSKSWNIIAEKCEGDILVMANDDEVWITKGWDRRLNEEADKFPDDIYCIYFDDGIMHEEICAFPMVSRKWYEILGYFTPGIFKFLANDTWIEYIAIGIGRLHYVPDVLVEHRHYLHKKSEIDETYKRNRDEYLGKQEDVLYLHSKECKDKIKEEAKKLFLKMEVNNDYIIDSIIELKIDFNELKSRVINLGKELPIVDCRINNIIDALAWFIPFRKKRDEFRNRLLDNFIRGGVKWNNNQNISKQYNFDNQVFEWSSPPVDDIGYIPSKEILNKSKKYIKKFVSDFENTRYSLSGWRNKENKWREYLGLDNTYGKNIIDFGCGYGIESLQFLKNGNKVSIADISEDNLNAVEKIINTMGYDIYKKIKVYNDYPFFEYDEKIDIFYSNGVLHHTPKIAEILQRVSEILKREGEIRLMLYSEKSYLLYADSILPPIEEDIRQSKYFDKFVKAMDNVGNYADWYSKGKIEYLLTRINKDIENKLRLVSYKYICNNDRYCVVVLKLE